MGEVISTVSIKDTRSDVPPRAAAIRTWIKMNGYAYSWNQYKHSRDSQWQLDVLDGPKIDIKEAKPSRGSGLFRAWRRDRRIIGTLDFEDSKKWTLRVAGTEGDLKEAKQVATKLSFLFDVIIEIVHHSRRREYDDNDWSFD